MHGIGAADAMAGVAAPHTGKLFVDDSKRLSKGDADAARCD